MTHEFASPDGRLAPEPLLRQHLVRWGIDRASNRPVATHTTSNLAADRPDLGAVAV
jgi:hypothetical protein